MADGKTRALTPVMFTQNLHDGCDEGESYKTLGRLFSWINSNDVGCRLGLEKQLHQEQAPSSICLRIQIRPSNSVHVMSQINSIYFYFNISEIKFIGRRWYRGSECCSQSPHTSAEGGKKHHQNFHYRKLEKTEERKCQGTLFFFFKNTIIDTILAHDLFEDPILKSQVKENLKIPTERNISRFRLDN